jgi:hypothetical protein
LCQYDTRHRCDCRIVLTLHTASVVILRVRDAVALRATLLTRRVVAHVSYLKRRQWKGTECEVSNPRNAHSAERGRPWTLQWPETVRILSGIAVTANGTAVGSRLRGTIKLHRCLPEIRAAMAESSENRTISKKWQISAISASGQRSLSN